MKRDERNRPDTCASLLVLASLAFLMAGCATTTGGRNAAGSQPPSVEQAIAAGDQAARRGDFERALVHYVQAVSAEPTVEGWLRVGAASTRLGHSQRAVNAYLQVLALDPRQPDALEGAGLQYMEAGQADAARELLTQVVQVAPQRWRAHNALGILADEAGDHVAAINHYEAALQVFPNSPMLLNNIGYSRYLAEDLDQAARDFYAATEIDPSYERAWANLALVYARRGWYEEAVRTLSKVREKATAYNDIGYLAFKRGDLEESEDLLAEAVRISPVYYETANRNLETVRARMRGLDERMPAVTGDVGGLISRDPGRFAADDS